MLGFTAGYIIHINCTVMLKVIYSGQIGGVINTSSLSLAPLGLAVIICALAACVHCLLINHYLTCSEGRRRAAVLFTWMTRVSSPQQQQQRWDPPVSHQRWDPERHDTLEDSWGLQGRMGSCVQSHKFTAS